MSHAHSEFAVLGGLLQDNSRFDEIDLVDSDFADAVHAQIFDAIRAIIADGSNADPVTVAVYLERMSSRISLNQITRLVENTPSSANVVHYARLVKDESKRRQALAIAKQLQETIGEDLTAVDEAIKALMSLDADRKNFECSIREASIAALDSVERVHNLDGALPGIGSGLKDLDVCLGGFQKSDLYIIGARPSVGKTALLLNLADNANASVGVISAEQGREQVALRLIAKNGPVNAHKMRMAELDDHGWSRASAGVSALRDRAIRINDKPNPTIEQVIRQARKWKFQYDVRAIYVDYIQRIRALPKSPRHEQVAHIAMSLKELARDLDIPVIALAQVNREVEARTDKRPFMSDLKDSGGIEQEADVIVLLYRDDVYNPASEIKGIAELHIAKNRHGPTGRKAVSWNADTMTFADLDFDAQRRWQDFVKPQKKQQFQDDRKTGWSR